MTEANAAQPRVGCFEVGDAVNPGVCFYPHG
jgi:hypothetical protein